MSPRVVFDTTVVLSALLFTSGRVAWLRAHWRAGDALPLASRATIEELTRYCDIQSSVHSGDEQRFATGLSYLSLILLTCQRGSVTVSVRTVWRM